MEASWLTLGMFSAALAGGATPPQTPSLLPWFSFFLERSSANFVKKSKNLPRTKPRIQEPAEDKAENKIRTNAFKKTQISKLCSSKLLSLSQPSLLQKRWAAVLPPRGASIRRPTGDGVLNDWSQVFFKLPEPFQSQSSKAKVLGV